MSGRRSRILAGVVLLIAFGCVRGGSNHAANPAEPPDSNVAFERMTIGPLVTDRASTGGVSLVDYDSDGDPDLYVTNGYDVSAEAPEPQLNRLYRNDGDLDLVVANQKIRITERPVSPHPP